MTTTTIIRSKMRKLFGTKSKKEKKQNEGTQENSSPVRKQKRYRDYIPHICIVAVCTFFIAAGLRDFLTVELEDAAARNEYEQLREIFTAPPEPEPIQEEIIDDDLDIIDEEPEEVQRLSMDELAKINSDLVGWISIENHIEYPVVRGNDNYKYMRTTFSGEENRAGAIFMDHRNRNGFDDYVAIIFGHRTRDGTMFAPLVSYLDNTFLRENPIITITTRDGGELTYRIFAAKLTDAWDTAYTMSFTDSARAPATFPNTPQNTTRFLLLSTCTPSSDRDERIIIYAMLEE